MEKNNFNFVKIAKPEFVKPHKRDILDANCFILLAGKMNSGKTSIIGEALKNVHLLGKKFMRIYFCGPSPWHFLSEKEKSTPGYEFQTDLSIGRIVDSLKAFNITCKEKKPDEKQDVLIILDDLLTEIEHKTNDALLNQMIYRRRHIFSHLTISFIVTAQYFNAFPRRFRQCLTHLVLFNVSDSDWKSITKDCSFRRSKLEESLVRAHFERDEHNWITINLSEGQIFLNFEDLLDGNNNF